MPVEIHRGHVTAAAASRPLTASRARRPAPRRPRGSG
jgi:hypothetical protein